MFFVVGVTCHKLKHCKGKTFKWKFMGKWDLASSENQKIRHFQSERVLDCLKAILWCGINFFHSNSDKKIKKKITPTRKKKKETNKLTCAKDIGRREVKTIVQSRNDFILNDQRQSRESFRNPFTWRWLYITFELASSLYMTWLAPARSSNHRM